MHELLRTLSTDQSTVCIEHCSLILQRSLVQRHWVVWVQVGPEGFAITSSTGTLARLLLMLMVVHFNSSWSYRLGELVSRCDHCHVST